MKRFKYDWLLYLIVSLLAIGLGIVLIVDNYSIGLKILDVALAVMLISYALLLLFPQIKNRRGTIQILIIIEFILIILISVGLVLQQFKVFTIAGSCRILGLIIWLRSIVEIFRAYFYKGKDSAYKYALWYLVIILALFTLGVYMFASPFFNDTQLILALSIALFVVAVILIVLGIAYLPKKDKTKKAKKESKK